MKQTTTEYKCPAWINFLNEVTNGNDEAVKQLQEFAGSCLAPQSCWGKALVLSGKGWGKTVFVKILREMVGTEKTSYVANSGFKNEFLRAELKDKWLNTSTLGSPDELDDAYFKCIVTGEFVTASVMHGDSFHFSPTCKLVLETSTLSVENRRCLTIDFGYRPASPARDLFHELLKEIDAIRDWAYEGLKRLIDQDCFSQGNKAD